MEIPHIPVLLEQVKHTFSDIGDGYIVDCTLGYGGHSEALLTQNPHVRLICCDQDAEAIAFSQKRLANFKDRVLFEHARFSTVVKKYAHFPIRGVLADIGVSSLQLDKKDRGFAFDSDVLDMRMNPQNPLSAYEVVNNYSKNELEEILREYGEVSGFQKIAQSICDERAIKPIKSAKELCQIIEKAGFKRTAKIHPATLVFQAIRIEVNNELGELDTLLESIYRSNINDCTVAIITFHSLEDRIVKRTFKDWAQPCVCPPHVMRCVCGKNHSLGKVLTKKPIEAKDDEIRANPRSRSAKMRVFKLERDV
ncbi:MAG: 16S rRNA (cytosine(1402)-N(4))-methyltransferase RsmH [Sulfurospirillaceae bacterium]|nr:16S rRNA (cytosine(1402)-N(4))-methyltransferase RsmH [Sulfurospirillaceae bacterium]